MAVSSRRKDRIFFSHREGTPFTADTTSFFEGKGTMTFPEPEYTQETNRNKLGAGEHGTKAEVQSILVPWVYNCQKVSEVAYLLSYFQGRSYTVVTSGSLRRHQINHLPERDRDLPTFTFQYGTGTANAVFSGAMVNEYSISFSVGGTGVVEATFSGFCNKHSATSNGFTLLSTGSMSDGQWNLNNEPVMNYKALTVWKADASNSLSAGSASYTGENLGANVVNISTLINSITMTGNNGMTMGDNARAGSYGVLNYRARSDRSYTLEIVMHKDDDDGIDTDDIIRNDTKLAIEVQWNGSYISGTDPHALDIVYPVVQAMSGQEDDESPIARTIPFEVFQDEGGNAVEIFVQSQVGDAYNATA